jgi:hypothetical protein
VGIDIGQIEEIAVHGLVRRILSLFIAKRAQALEHDRAKPGKRQPEMARQDLHGAILGASPTDHN